MVTTAKPVLASAVGYGLDGFDFLIIGFALPAIIATFHLTPTQAGWLPTLTLIGAVVGGLIAGVLADRYGRVRVLVWTVVVFAVFTALGSLAQGYTDFAIYRFLAGLGLGGEFGVGMALAAEAVTAKNRARATSTVAVGWQIGVLLAALVSAPIMQLVGWRGLFVVGLFPALIALVMRLTLVESPVYAEHRSSSSDKPGTTGALRLLIRDRSTTTSTLAILVLTIGQNFGYYGLLVWLPHYLSDTLGLGLTKGSVWTGVTVLGMIVGIVTFGHLADHIGRRPTFWIFQAGAAASILIYSQLTASTALLIGGFVVGAFGNGMLGGIGAVLAESYPTAARATAQNVLFNAGRAIGGFAPVVVALIAGSHGFQYALMLFPVIYLVEAIAVRWIPERRAAVLE